MYNFLTILAKVINGRIFGGGRYHTQWGTKGGVINKKDLRYIVEQPQIHRKIYILFGGSLESDQIMRVRVFEGGGFGGRRPQTEAEGRGGSKCWVWGAEGPPNTPNQPTSATKRHSIRLNDGFGAPKAPQTPRINPPTLPKGTVSV